MGRIGRARWRRLRTIALFGGLAIGAVALAMVTGLYADDDAPATGAWSSGRIVLSAIGAGLLAVLLVLLVQELVRRV